MPQENGWATGPEHCDEDGRVCPYCGSENTDSGSLDIQAGQVVESGCECLECGKTWGNLYNIAGWYDEAEELHEDLRDFNARENVKVLQTSLDVCLRDLLSIHIIDGVIREEQGKPALPEPSGIAAARSALKATGWEWKE